MIDWNKVSELRDEIGAEDFGEIVDCFLQEVEEKLALLPTAPKENLSEALHFLKGSALNLGFSEFAELCRVGEACSNQGRPDSVDVDRVIASYHASKDVFLASL